MAYTTVNFKNKKQLKEAFKSKQKISVYQSGPFGPSVPDGSCVLEGPHYPAPHSWYASVVVEKGVVVKIKG